MRANCSRLPLLLFALLSLWLTNRLVPGTGEPPVFFVRPRIPLQFELPGSWSRSGVYQLFDGWGPGCVNELTSEECAALQAMKNQDLNGSILALDSSGAVVFGGWLPATQRMALQIPLHPDRMTRDDWPGLPGLGPYLARTIEDDRQMNGEFGTFKRLRRVRGIGEKRLAALKPYFDQD